MTAPPTKRKSVLNCRNKRRYADELAARAAAMDAIQRHRNTETLFVYQCNHCHGWHLTRQHSRSPAVTADNPVMERA